MQVAGIPMMVNSEHTVIFAKLRCLLSDGDGLRMALQWNGASGIKPCFWLWSVVKPRSLLDEVEPYVNTFCSDPSQLQVLGEGDLHTLIDVAVEATNQ